MFAAAVISTRFGLALMATSLAPVPAAPCQVELSPGDAPRAWKQAAAAVRELLRDGGDADLDCRAVVIHVDRERPLVEVVTHDGRRGVRRLADAEGVVPMVAALIVTVHADELSGHQPAAPQERLVNVSSSLRRPDSPITDPSAAVSRLQAVIGGGGRWSLPGTQAAQLEINFGIARPRWELGLFGAWAPTAVAVGTSAPVNFGSTVELAISGAWRPALTSSIDLIVGGRAGVAWLADGESNAPDSPAGGDTGGNNVDPSFNGTAPAITGFIGAAFATRSVVHVRPQLWYQWSPAMRLGGQDATARLSSVGLSLGVESRVP